MEIIKCPSCGENNTSDMEFCQNCQARLQPLTGPLKGEDKAIKPGQIPTNKSTAELEPLLPKWLKDARDSARTGEEEKPAQTSSANQMPAQQAAPKKPSAPAGDFLSGLQAQSGDDEDDEVPDWLASITGDTSKPKSAAEETTDTRWVEMGNRNDYAQEDAAADADTPSWLAGLQPLEPHTEEKDELTDWFRTAAEEQKPSYQDPAPIFESPVEQMPPAKPVDDTPDWLRQMAADAEAKLEPVQADVYQDAPEFSLDAPDWLSNLGGAAMESKPESAQPVKQQESTEFPLETPDWLSSLGSVEIESKPEPAQPVEIPLETPDWLSSLGGAEAAQMSEEESVVFAESSLAGSEAEEIPSFDIPDWMKSSADDAKPLQDTTPRWLREESNLAGEPEVPAWLSGTGSFELSSEKAEETPAQSEDSEGIPAWLKAAEPHHFIEETPAAEVGPLQTPSAEEERSRPFNAEPPAFEADPTATEDLFTEMPSWLSDAMEQPSSSTPTAITNTDALSPSELPSWVQAMRPVDASASQPASLSSDQTLESRGALAGLQGVLPAVPGYMPTSKPKAYSIKLTASDEQLAHAEILEQILAAETAPVPLEVFSNLRASRSLRWLISALLLIGTILTVSLRTQIFASPSGVPNEMRNLLFISQSIPDNAPILVAMDYEPSRAGEMQAAAAPLLDNLMLLRAPRLTFIATNETGAILAERLMAGPLAVHNYTDRVSYLNLGYLPGGQLGIRAFAQSPTLAAPLDISLQPAWETPPLEGVIALNQFAAMILITDNAEAARIWIEQTQELRGTMPFIIISSAQAAPMIQPYYNSAQVTGIIPGLQGGAVFEQYNASRPGTARSYWDAYSLGMLLAVVLVFGGGLWSLISGMRERANAGEGK
ncbi:MAG: zinc ribbon domain-containing protein [Chloroflexi bacterium]|nr:zinc ribbon domain-containing protein [Chloroflexota bacterium]